MLIIAVIVAVSIRITKAKLDKVISYSYYSAYSTLSDVSRSMYLDLKGHRVDLDYYLSFVNLIKDVKEDLSVKAASVKVFLKNSFITPAYAASTYLKPTVWSGKPFYACAAKSEYWLDTKLCSTSDDSSSWNYQKYSPDSYNPGTFYAFCKDSSGINQFGPYHLPKPGETPYKLDCTSKNYKEQIILCLGTNNMNNFGCNGNTTWVLSAGSSLPNGVTNQFGGTPSLPQVASMISYVKSLAETNNKVYYGSEIMLGSYGIPEQLPNSCEYKYNGKCYQGYNYFAEVLSSGTPTIYKCANGYYSLHGSTPDYYLTCADNGGTAISGGYTTNYRNLLSKCPTGAELGAMGHLSAEQPESYLNINEYTISGNCYYAQMKCGEDSFIWVGNGSNPYSYGRAVCIPCSDRYNSDHILASDRKSVDFTASPYNCPKDKDPSGGGGSGGGGGSEPDPDTEPEEPEEPVQPEVCNPAVSCGCGYEPSANGCECKAIENFEREESCSASQVWSESACGCVSKVPSLPKTGSKFCELFETYVNKSGTACNGDSIADNTTDFSSKKPDITLRNGIKLYNMSKGNERLLEDLETMSGLEETDEMSDSYREIYFEQHGYLVYADIDGKNGDSKLWEDVYPFYITLTGKVIPLFDKDNPGQSGADSKNHLEVSVSRRKFQQRGTDWIVKSEPFQRAACTAGYVSADAPYCKDYSLGVDNRCFANVNIRYSPCKLKPIKPIGFFF